MTKYSQSSESTNPVEFSIPDDSYHIPEVFALDLDLDLVGKKSAETTTEAVPRTDPVAAQTPPEPVRPSPEFVVPLQPTTQVVWVYNKPKITPIADQRQPTSPAPGVPDRDTNTLQPKNAPAVYL